MPNPTKSHMYWRGKRYYTQSQSCKKVNNIWLAWLNVARGILVAVITIITYSNRLKTKCSPGFHDYMTKTKYVKKTPPRCRKMHFFQQVYYIRENNLHFWDQQGLVHPQCDF